MVELALHHPHPYGPFFLQGISAVTAWCFPVLTQTEVPLWTQSQHLDFLIDSMALWGCPVFHFVFLNLLYDTNIYSGEEATMCKNIRWVYAALSAAAWTYAHRGWGCLTALSTTPLEKPGVQLHVSLPTPPNTCSLTFHTDPNVSPFWGAAGLSNPARHLNENVCSVGDQKRWSGIHDTLPSPALIKTFLFFAGAYGKSCCAWSTASHQPAQQESMEHHRGAHLRSPWLTAEGQHFKKM